MCLTGTPEEWYTLKLKLNAKIPSSIRWLCIVKNIKDRKIVFLDSAVFIVFHLLVICGCELVATLGDNNGECSDGSSQSSTVVIDFSIPIALMRLAPKYINSLDVVLCRLV